MIPSWQRSGIISGANIGPPRKMVKNMVFNTDERAATLPAVVF
jgi:hypothetical protein